MAHLHSVCPLTGHSPVGPTGLTGVQEAAQPVTHPESAVTETTEAPQRRSGSLSWSLRGEACPSGCEEAQSSAGSSKSEKKKNAHKGQDPAGGDGAEDLRQALPAPSTSGSVVYILPIVGFHGIILEVLTMFHHFAEGHKHSQSVNPRQQRAVLTDCLWCYLAISLVSG